MKIEPDSASAGLLKITITNLNQRLVIVGVSGVTDYRVQIKRDDGAPVNQSEYGKSLAAGERGGSRAAIKLDANEAFSESLDLRQLFELKTGSYTVQISRDVVIRGVRVPLRAVAAVSVP